MFEKEIQFISSPIVAGDQESLPKPIKNNIPLWYKKLKHSVNNQTIKGCIPFLETLTTGYVLSLYQDMQIKHNIASPENIPHQNYVLTSLADSGVFSQDLATQLNVNFGNPDHPIKQLGESPLVVKNNHCPFIKIMNPWIIKTPPGYSCLFVPPLNNTDDRFSIIPGIVDTDKFEMEINFPCVFNGDKYKTLDTILKKGTAYVQIIPFKRDGWKMTIKKHDKSTHTKNWQTKFNISTSCMNGYKSIFWKKKSWK